jgi:hypothetical protein
MAGNDGMPWSGRLGNLGRTGQSPFILSTPHHSMAWAAPATPVESQGGDSQVVAQYKQTLIQMEKAMQQEMDELASLTNEYNQRIDALAQLDAEYQKVLNEYEILTKGSQG